MWIGGSFNTVDAGEARAVPEQDIQPVHGVGRTVSHHLHTAVRAIGHPADKSEVLRVPQDEPPEAHALNPSLNHPSHRMPCAT
jgi:hypothetical protein